MADIKIADLTAEEKKEFEKVGNLLHQAKLLQARYNSAAEGFWKNMKRTYKVNRSEDHYIEEGCLYQFGPL